MSEAAARSLSPESLDKLRAVGRTVTFEAGAVIFREEDPGDSLLVVKEGLARAVRHAASGRSSILAFLGKGDVVGEIACLGGLPRAATVECVTALEGHLVSRGETMALFEKDFRLCQEMLSLLCRRLAATDEIAQRTGAQTMRSKLAGALLMLAREHGVTDDAGTWISLPITRSEFGAFAGLSRENVSRVLADWRRQRIVNYSDNERELLIMEVSVLEDIRDEE